MKSTMYIITCSLFVLFSACGKNSDTYFNKVETKLKVDIPVSGTISDDLNADMLVQDAGIPFSGTIDYQLSEIIDPSDKIMVIHSIKPVNGSTFSIRQIKNRDEISSLHFSWGYKAINDADYIMLESIDFLSSDYSIVDDVLEFNLNKITNLSINGINNSDIMIRFNIKGNCNKSLSDIANLEIPVIIETEFYSPRFELF